MEKLLLGFDVGTSGSKGVIITCDGEVVASASAEHGVDVPQPAWAEQDPEAIYWGDFKLIVAKMLSQARIDPKRIAGIGVSGLTPDVAPIDRDGNVVRPCIIYMDRRATAECEWVRENIGEEKVFEISGNAIDPYFAGYKILWYARNERQNYERTWKMLNSHAYIIFKLTGEAVVDYGVAGLTAPLFDIRKMKWSEEMCDVCGIDINKLPDPYPAHQVIGQVTEKAAAETGLAPGTPVVAGGGVDASCSAFSVGMIEPGTSACMYGTTHCWQIALDKPQFDPRFINFPHVYPGTYVSLAGMGTTGAIIRWFRDEFGIIEKSVESNLGLSAYKILDLEAAKIPPGSDGLIVLPYFMGERTPIWDPFARGVIFGLSLYHTRAHIYRAIMEGIGYGLRHHAEIARELGIMPKRIVAVDGGASSSLFRQIVTDIMDVPQDYTAKIAGAPVTDAFLAGVGVGIYKDFNEIKKWIILTEKNEPNPEATAIYMKLYDVYRRLYEKTAEEMHYIARLNEK
ncbi:MAG: FGGY-family carbohydrate kinase [Thermosediminibacteraceae bacterium]|nr:FGGY-family carbohydrate kinase [Thermosediminibacteraceae bacterium]